MIARIRRFVTAQRALSLDAEGLAALQAQKLRAIVHHAYDTVPYYRSLFDRAGVTPSDIRSPADLGRLPITSKEDLRDADPSDLISRATRASALHVASTSGSTGLPLEVRRSPQDLATRKMFDFRALIAIGFRPLEKLATYTVRKPKYNPGPQKIFYRNQWISALQPTGKGAAELSEYDPDWLWCYPSSFNALINQVNGRLHEICRPRALVTTSERPDELTRRSCEDLHIEHFNFYGAIETGRIAWECRAHAGLHLNVDNVVLEIEPLNGSETLGADGLGETIVTTLNNTAMPLIRYRLGDLCRLLDRPCPCGIALPLIAPPHGRTADLLQLPSGGFLSARGLVSLVRSHHGIRQLRITQIDPERIEVQLIVDRTFAEDAPGTIQSQLRNALQDAMSIDVALVDSIGRPGEKPREFLSLVEPPRA